MKTFGELSGKFNLYSKILNTENYTLSDLVIHNAEVECDVVDYPLIRQFILDDKNRIRLNVNESYRNRPNINGINFIATSEEALDAAIYNYKENSIKEIEKAIKEWERDIKMRENLIKKSMKNIEKISKL